MVIYSIAANIASDANPTTPTIPPAEALFVAALRALDDALAEVVPVLDVRVDPDARALTADPTDTKLRLAALCVAETEDANADAAFVPVANTAAAVPPPVVVPAAAIAAPAALPADVALPVLSPAPAPVAVPCGTVLTVIAGVVNVITP